MSALDTPACPWLGQGQGGECLEVPDPCAPPPGYENPATPNGQPAQRGRGTLTFDPRQDNGREDARTPDVFGRGDPS